MEAIDSQMSTTTKLKRVAWLSSRDKALQFDNLMHRFNEASLGDCFYRLDGRKAVGIDGVSAMNEVSSFVVSPVREIRTLGSNEGGARVTCSSTL